MRDVTAGRDIVNSPITEIVGIKPSNKILQLSGEELAEAEANSRKIVSGRRKVRLRTALVLLGVTLAGLAATALLGYYWLLAGGEVSIVDIVTGSANYAMGALISTGISILVTIAGGTGFCAQKDPSDAEKINLQRLRSIQTRWHELQDLGLNKQEIKKLRRKR